MIIGEHNYNSGSGFTIAPIVQTGTASISRASDLNLLYKEYNYSSYGAFTSFGFNRNRFAWAYQDNLKRVSIQEMVMMKF